MLHRLDADPWILGNALLFEILKRSGDIEGAVDEAVTQASHGWLSYPERRRAPSGEGRAFWRRQDLDSDGLIDWLYVFDLERRRLDVWGADPQGEPLYTVSFDAEGLGSPALFAQPRPEAPSGRLLHGWKGDDPAIRGFRERVTAALGNADIDAIAEGMTSGLGRALRAVDWVPFTEASETVRLRERLGHEAPGALSLWPEEDCVWMVRPFAEPAGRFWEVTLDGFRVRYPVPHSRAEDDVGDEAVALRFDGAYARWPSLLTVFPYRSPDGPAERLLRAGVHALVGDQVPFQVEGDQVFFLKTVVETVNDPVKQVGLAEARTLDPDCGPGDTLGWDLPAYGGLYGVLDWLRSLQRPVAGEGGRPR